MKRTFTSLLLALAFVQAFAQTTIRVEAPNMVAEDEQFNLTFIVEGDSKPASFTWNINSDFKLVWGPQKGSSTSINMINGKTTKTSQYTYTYVLIPTKTGRFTIPAATATVKGEQISSRAVDIEVLPSGSSAGRSSSSSSGSSSQSASPQQRSSGGTMEISQQDLFLRFSVNKTTAVIGEPLYATLKIYSAVNISGFEDAKLPSFNGFWSQENAPSQIQFNRESYNGRIYDAALIRSYIIIPQQAGDLRIDPAELVTLVSVRNPRRSGSIFDDFFDNGYSTIRKRLTTPEVTIHVNKLPEGAPSSFGGGVGSYKISSKVTRDSLKTHDASSLVITVSGKGNVSLLEAPKVHFPPDMDVYDTKVTGGNEKGSTSGSKVFEYPFIPRSHGDFTIDPVQYSYYDVSSGRYVTLSTEPIDIHVDKGAVQETSSSGITIQPSDRKGVRNLGEDIRYISTSRPDLSKGGKWLISSLWYWLLLAVLLGGAAAVWAVRRKAARLKADVALTKNRKATKMAMSRLRQAREFLDKGLGGAFYEELHKALLGFISDKLNMGAEDLGKESIAGKLAESGVSEDLAGRFTSLLDECEFARYSPVGGDASMEKHYEQAVNIISSIDSSMKHHNRGGGAALALILALILPGTVRAQEADSLWTRGVAAYESEQWESAAAAWGALAESGVQSPVLQYNLGNARFKAGDYPGAILCYERALKADPSFTDARYNLEYVNSLIQDRIEEVPEFILKAWLRKVSYIMSSNAWAVAGAIFFVLMLGMILLFLLASSTGARKTGFFSAIAALLLCAGCLGFSAWQYSDGTASDKAIVTRPVSSVKSSPAGSTDLFVLHEGTKVRILEDVGEWKNISLADGRQGWIRSSDIETI